MRISDLVAAMRAAQDIVSTPAVEMAIKELEKHRATAQEVSKHMALLGAVEKNSRARARCVNLDPPCRSIVRREVRRRVGFAPFDKAGASG